MFIASAFLLLLNNCNSFLIHLFTKLTLNNYLLHSQCFYFRAKRRLTALKLAFLCMASIM